MPNKLKIAITGGIGAGKSEVSRIIEQNGYSIIYADKLAKELLASDPQIKNFIISEFGDAAYINGKPDKIYLSEKVFNNQSNVEKVNSVIHPKTIDEIVNRMNKILKKDDLVFVESALIFEAKRQELFDYIIHVNASKEKRIERASKLLNLKSSEIEKRMSYQISDEEKKKNADFVIENDSTLNALEVKTKLILNILKSISQG